MVPFRAIAEVLGAEVTYDAGCNHREKGGETLSFALGGKQLTITDSAGKTVKPCSLIPRRTKGGAAPMFRCAFCRSVRPYRAVGSDMQTRRDCMTARRLYFIDSKFTVLNKWIRHSHPPKTPNAAHGGDDRRGVHRLRHHRRQQGLQG